MEKSGRRQSGGSGAWTKRHIGKIQWVKADGVACRSEEKGDGQSICFFKKPSVIEACWLD